MATPTPPQQNPNPPKLFTFFPFLSFSPAEPTHPHSPLPLVFLFPPDRLAPPLRSSAEHNPTNTGDCNVAVPDPRRRCYPLSLSKTIVSHHSSAPLSEPSSTPLPRRSRTLHPPLSDPSPEAPSAESSADESLLCRKNPSSCSHLICALPKQQIRCCQPCSIAGPLSPASTATSPHSSSSSPVVPDQRRAPPLSTTSPLPSTSFSARPELKAADHGQDQRTTPLFASHSPSVNEPTAARQQPSHLTPSQWTRSEHNNIHCPNHSSNYCPSCDCVANTGNPRPGFCNIVFVRCLISCML